MTVEERIQKGAEFLDRVKPGWEKQINSDKLDIASCFDCILGQLYGRYSSAVSKLSEIHDIGVRNDMGFTSADDERNMEKELTQAWKEEIEKRRIATQK